MSEKEDSKNSGGQLETSQQTSLLSNPGTAGAAFLAMIAPNIQRMSDAVNLGIDMLGKIKIKMDIHLESDLLDNDPVLANSYFESTAKATQGLAESARKWVDTAVKAKSLLDGTPQKPEGNDIPPEENSELSGEEEKASAENTKFDVV